MTYRSYPEYLESPHWTFTRKKIFERDSYKCVICKKDANQVHHINYRNWVDVVDSDLISVCEECHCKIHIAIDKGYISLNNDGSLAKTLGGLEDCKNNKPLSDFQIKERTNVLLTEKILSKWDGAPHQNKKLIRGILKKSISRSFRELKGIVINSEKFNSIERLANFNSLSKRNCPERKNNQSDFNNKKFYNSLLTNRRKLPPDILLILNEIGDKCKNALTQEESAKISLIKQIFIEKYNIKRPWKILSKSGKITCPDKNNEKSQILVDASTQNR